MTETPVNDVFISHAFEDKNDFANELALELTKAGLKVWYSGFELKLGDSIAESINKGLKGAAFGIVIISPVYFQKRWAMNELNALFAREEGQNKILPILHNITVGELKEHFPILADRYTISSAQGMDFIIRKIWQAIAGTRGSHNKILSAPEPGKSSREKASNKNENDEKTATIQNSNSNVNKNSNHVTVNTGNGKVITIIILIIIALALYFFYENSASAPPAVNKEHSTPSNSN